MDLLRSTVLNKIATANQKPEHSFLIYDLNGGIYHVPFNRYMEFYHAYIRVSQLDHLNNQLFLTVDLCSLVSHVLYLDIDAETVGGKFVDVDTCNQCIEEYLTSFVIPFFRSYFQSLPHFMFIVTRRSGGLGIHIHFPELIIYHDDYLLICAELRKFLNQCIRGVVQYEVDCPRNFTLPMSRKVAEKPYIFRFVVYCKLNDDNNIIIRCYDKTLFNTQILKFRNVVKKSSSKKGPESIFKALMISNYENFRGQILGLLMPKIENPIISHFVLYFPFIVQEEICDLQQQKQRRICHFLLYVDTYTTKNISLLKNMELQIQPKYELPLYGYLKCNSCRIQNFETENEAVKRWQFWLQASSNLETVFFKDISREICILNPSLRHKKNPVIYIMEYNNCFAFFPIYLTLCNLYQLNLAADMKAYPFKNPKSLSLLTKLQKLSWCVLHSICSTFTKNTIIYCALNYNQSFTQLQPMINYILKQWESQVIECEYGGDTSIIALIRRVQNYFFPICRDKFKRQYYIWNTVCRKWLPVAINEIKQIISTIYYFLKLYHHDMNRSEPIGLQRDSELYLMHSITAIEAMFERREMEFNANKWALCVHSEILDLFTCTLSMAVPEFYITDMQLGISLVRDLFESRMSCTHLIELEQTMWSESFINRYKEELLKYTDNYDESMYTSVLLSMLEYHDSDLFEFFIHMCKFLNFEADRMNFLMDIITSVFIATNFHKQLVIFQGFQNNGKTKVFKILEKVFGSYFAPVSSNTFVNSDKKDTTPDLTINIYSRRLILVEELAGQICENLIKKITGNCNISLRNIYENPRQGIPDAKIFCTSNTAPHCIAASEAFKSRIIPFEFRSMFTPTISLSIAEQIQRETYPAKPDEAIVMHSVMGLFYHALLRLQRILDYETGYFDLPLLPESMRNFKERYIEIMDVYCQFKHYADVQILPSTTTTKNDVLSAIRNFLKQKKLTMIRVETIMEKFDREFEHCKYIDNFEEGINEEENEINAFIASAPLLSDEEIVQKKKRKNSKVLGINEEDNEINSFIASSPLLFDEEISRKKKRKISKVLEEENEINSFIASSPLLSDEEISRKKKRTVRKKSKVLDIVCYRNVQIKNIYS